MNILIVAATQFEVQPLLDFLGISYLQDGLYITQKSLNTLNNKQVSILITGIGMVNTAYKMGRYVDSETELVINAGICGSFNKSLELGELVHITEDILSELGAEDGDKFLTYDKLDLPGEFIFKNQLQNVFPKIKSLKTVKGITVNTVHGNEKTIQHIKQIYHPDVESMEGAAFFASCQHLKKNFTQIRTISNYIEKRNRDKWQIPLAIKNLNDFLINLITTIH